LRLALEGAGGDPRRLFNTSGRDYRELDLAARLPGMPLPEVLRLLRENGNLVKRPFVVTSDDAWAGFNEAVWKKRFRAACP
jgi:arsenate reductase-like glutaredoxin family protein